MIEDRIRYFAELSAEEQDEAIAQVFLMHSADYESGRIDLFGALTETEIHNRLWENAGALAQNAIYIPDDGALVVRL